MTPTTVPINPAQPEAVSADFCTALTQEFLRSMYNECTDNIDYDRFSALKPPSGIRHWFRERLKSLLGRKRVHFLKEEYQHDPYLFAQLTPYLGGYSWLYDRLTDDASRQLWLKLLAYRVLGANRVKLPINTPDYHRWLVKVKAAASATDQIPIGFMNWRLPLVDLNPLVAPLRLYCMPLGVLCTFIYQQYRYRWSTPQIGAEPGETVIDCGGCWGDSALYFANTVGSSGKVVTAEFIPTNLEILRKNLALNPELAPRVTVVESPVWDRSGQEFFSQDNGPGSRVSTKPSPELNLRCTSVSIDDLVARQGLSRVEFIKMDIEGAELNALRGAEQTLRRFRPKLAIAVYHQLSDYAGIPRWIDQLQLGYRFTLDHFTIYGEETVLFANVPGATNVHAIGREAAEGVIG